MTLKEFDALCKRKRIDDKRVERYSAQIACLFYNAHRGEKTTMKVIKDFMSEESLQKSEKQSPEVMKQHAKMITKLFNGEFK